MFNLNFTELNPISIADQIKKNGYFIIENALTTEYIDQLLKEIDFERTLVNSNDVGVVLSGNQKFLTYCLAKSKKVYDIVTYDKVVDIC
ncbi:MAG: phytanoyl-CoA dioxygenase, partial [Trichodesmium sp. St17_bin3_1_1]|nr:phytanoyl-CoA dioxygenase [Trichodesmium sp. St17_bin3_1_1]